MYRSLRASDFVAIFFLAILSTRDTIAQSCDGRCSVDNECRDDWQWGIKNRNFQKPKNYPLSACLCTRWKGICDVTVGHGRALQGLYSRHDNNKKDRVWYFGYTKSDTDLAFVDDTNTDVITTSWTQLNVDWEFISEDDKYLVGWESKHFNNDNDRKYRLHFRYLANGWTQTNCETTNYNSPDGVYKEQTDEDMYIVGIKTEWHSNDQDRKFKHKACRISPPPPPPPSPPPSPPPLPPPPGGDNTVDNIGTDLEVSIDNPADRVTDKEFNFNIKVTDSECGEDDCFGTVNNVEINTAKGLKCEAYVKKTGDDTCDYSTAATHAPCLKWDNFFNGNKLGETRFSFSSADSTGVKQTGEYEIKYNCYWHFADGTKVPNSGNPVGTDSFNSLHIFTVSDGCSDVMQSTIETTGTDRTTMQSVARLLLLSSPIFLNIDACHDIDIDVAKEEVFRKYDISPMDGKLSLNELRYAFESHDMQTTYLDHLEGIDDVKLVTNGGLLLQDIMNVVDLPNMCYLRGGNGVIENDLYMTDSTYSIPDWEESTCIDHKEHVEVSWGFAKEVQNGDFMAQMIIKEMIQLDVVCQSIHY